MLDARSAHCARVTPRHGTPARPPGRHPQAIQARSSPNAAAAAASLAAEPLVQRHQAGPPIVPGLQPNRSGRCNGVECGREPALSSAQQVPAAPAPPPALSRPAHPTRRTRLAYQAAGGI